MRGEKVVTIKGEQNPRTTETANSSFATSVTGCRHIAGEALAPYFVCTSEPYVEDGVDIPGTIIDTTTGAPQSAQWLKNGSFDGFQFASWVLYHLKPCIPKLSRENLAMVICDPGWHWNFRDDAGVFSSCVILMHQTCSDLVINFVYTMKLMSSRETFFSPQTI